jgi:ribosome-associated heat shock protein Hsp15
MAIDNLSEVRIDRWLWSVRIFKTRSLATEACKKNSVKINDQPLKASKLISVGQIISIKLGPLVKVVEVTGLTEKRVSASLVCRYLTDLTTEEAYAKAKQLKIHLKPRLFTKKGLGRPTKKQRRELDEFLYPED